MILNPIQDKTNDSLKDEIKLNDASFKIKWCFLITPKPLHPDPIMILWSCFFCSDITAAATMGVESAFTCTLPQYHRANPQCKEATFYQFHSPQGEDTYEMTQLCLWDMLGRKPKKLIPMNSHVLPAVESQDWTKINIPKVIGFGDIEPIPKQD